MSDLAGQCRGNGRMHRKLQQIEQADFSAEGTRQWKCVKTDQQKKGLDLFSILECVLRLRCVRCGEMIWSSASQT